MMYIDTGSVKTNATELFHFFIFGAVFVDYLLIIL
jgi:hypothetical protein